MSDECAHEQVKPAFCDQTLGVECVACRELLAWCWSENHIPIALWNRACQNDPDARTEDAEDRGQCAICGEPTRTE